MPESSSLATLRALVDQLEVEAARVMENANRAPDRVARLEEIRSRVAQIKRDLIQLGE